MAKPLTDDGKFGPLFQELMRFCLVRGIPFADAQDLVGSAVEAAVRTYDPARGAFAALAQTALANRVKNHWRDRKPVDPLDAAGDIPDPGAHPDVLDAVAHDQERLRGIMKELTADEKAFLLALQSVLDEMDTRAVSEAARRLGLTAAKGWDLFRKIQRKAHRAGRMDDQIAFRVLESAAPLRMDIDLSVNEPLAPPAASAPAPDGASQPKMPDLREMSALVREEGPVDLPMRALATFVAMEHAFARFRAGLSDASLAVLKNIS